MKIVSAIWACIAQLGVVFGEPEPQLAYGLTQPYFTSSRIWPSKVFNLPSPGIRYTVAPASVGPILSALSHIPRVSHPAGGVAVPTPVAEEYHWNKPKPSHGRERRKLPWFYSRSPREVFVMAMKKLIHESYPNVTDNQARVPLWLIRQKLTQYGFDTYFAEYDATTDSIMNMLAKEAENGEVSISALKVPYNDLEFGKTISWRQLPNAAKEDDSYIQLEVYSPWLQFWYPHTVRAGLRSSTFVGEDGRFYLEDSLACELAKEVVGVCQLNRNGEMCAESFCTTGSWTAWKKKEVQKENKDNHPRPSFSDFWDESDIKRFFNRGGMGVVTNDGKPNFSWGKKRWRGSTSSLGTSLSGGQVSTAFDHDPRLRCCAMQSPYQKGLCLCRAEQRCYIYQGEDFASLVRDLGWGLKCN